MLALIEIDPNTETGTIIGEVDSLEGAAALANHLQRRDSKRFYCVLGSARRLS